MICYDRNRESVVLWRYFKKRKNVLMLAPRRVGKTVLINRLKEESDEHGFRSIILDVEGYREEKAFFRQMCASIQEEIGVGQAVLASFTERLKSVLQGKENSENWRSILLTTDWNTFADHLLAQLSESKDEKQWLFLVDEIPLFIKELIEDGPKGPQKAYDFLYTLRRLQQKYQKIRWLFTGSIGLDTIARRHGLEGALVEMEVFTLEPFDKETARAFIKELATQDNRSFDDSAIDRMLDRLGWLSPYYLEKITQAACSKALNGTTIGESGADLAANALLSLSHRTYWSTWREHLDKNFTDPERTYLFALLAALSRSPEGMMISTLLAVLNKGGTTVGEKDLRDYLDTLEADGYIKADEDRSRFRFCMNLLREWWLRYVAPGAVE